MEGHPDNVAASLLGGVTAYVDGRAARLEPPAGLSPILVVPRTAVRTAAARAALPATVPLADAAANAGHAALLALGLERGDLDLVAAGLCDRIHQPYRAHLFPQSAALLERAPALGALGATISGAGPTVLVWARTEAEAAVTEALECEVGGWARVMPARFEPRGARVLEG
jgi:homoserine kinase